MLIPHHLTGKQIGVLGLGRSGIAVCQAVAQVADTAIYAHDDDAEVKPVLPDRVITAPPTDWPWRELDYLVISPGIPTRHPKPHAAAAMARTAGVAIICDIEILMQMDIKARFIGITGTNGKSTTAALTAHLLKCAGVPGVLGGNIGTAVLTMPIPDVWNDPGKGGVIVLELSSYQLEITPSLHLDAAAILNITPDHLDRHGGWDGYVAAKEAIGRGVEKSGGALLLGADAPCQAIGKRYPKLAQPIDPSLVAKHKLPTSLTGSHNQANAAAAIQLIAALGIKINADNIQQHLTSFTGLPHRLEWLGVAKQVAFVNDSKATNGVAAAQALASYPMSFWIVGGQMKEDSLAAIKPYTKHIRCAYVIGRDTEKTIAVLPKGVTYQVAGSLDKAVAMAFADAVAAGEVGAVVLLAPAAASFDQFANFEARGECFRALAQALIQANPSNPSNREAAHGRV